MSRWLEMAERHRRDAGKMELMEQTPEPAPGRAINSINSINPSSTASEIVRKAWADYIATDDPWNPGAWR